MCTPFQQKFQNHPSLALLFTASYRDELKTKKIHIHVITNNFGVKLGEGRKTKVCYGMGTIGPTWWRRQSPSLRRRTLWAMIPGRIVGCIFLKVKSSISILNFEGQKLFVIRYYVYVFFLCKLLNTVVKTLLNSLSLICGVFFCSASDHCEQMSLMMIFSSESSAWTRKLLFNGTNWKQECLECLLWSCCQKSSPSVERCGRLSWPQERVGSIEWHVVSLAISRWSSRATEWCPIQESK